MTTIITATAKDWLAALNFIAPSIKARPLSPELYCVRISPITGSLVGTDFEVRAEANLAEFEGEGVPFLAHYRGLVDAIKLTTKGDRTALVTVSPRRAGEEFFVTVDAAGYSLSLAGADVAEFPKPDPVKVTSSIRAAGRDLKAAINRVGIAASKDDTLPILNGIHFEHDGDDLTLFATDRYRLATDTVKTLNKVRTPITFLLRIKTATEIARRMLVNDEVLVDILNGDRVRFRLPAGTISSLLIDGDYPKLRTLFPTSPNGSFDVERGPLLAAAKVAASMTERNMPVVLKFGVQGLRLEFVGGLFGDSTSPLIASEASGHVREDFQTAFNPNYLIESLAAIASDTVRLSYTSAPKPVMVTEAASEAAHKHLLMPVRLPSRVEL